MAMAAGLLAGLGRWCFRHRWWVLAIWLVAVVGGVLAAGPVFSGLKGGNGPRSLESVRAQQVLDESSDTGDTLYGEVDRVDPHTTGVRNAVTATAAQLAAVPGVAKVVTPYSGDPAAGIAIARDGHALLVAVKLRKLGDDAADTAAGAVLDKLRALRGSLVAAGQPDAQVLLGGDRLINDQADAQAQKDLSQAEEISLPITLVILVIIFGGLVAAGMPVLAAIVSVFAAMAVLLGFSYFTDLDQNAVTVVTLLGLGLSVDYGLLLVVRYREELGLGHPPEVAISRAWATAGRTIAFSALTVAAALTGLLLFGISGLATLGAAGVSIALVAMLSSLTLTAGLLGLARRRVRPSRRVARHTARYGDAAEVGFFAALARRVQRRPLTTALVTGIALLAAGFPLLSMKMHLDDIKTLPRSLESVRVADDLANRFGLAQTPAVTVVARTDAATLDAWARRWATAPGVARVAPAEQVAPNLSIVDIQATGTDPENAAARDLVLRIRADRPAGVESWVTGPAAVLDDVLGQLLHRLPLSLGVTLLTMVALLFAMTGSLVIPVKAIAMNVVSLGATFGVLSAVFEHGFLAGPLHVQTVDGIGPFVIVSVFAFAFGLSMDYEVFLLSRIKEYVDSGWDTATAVRRGLQHTGRVITSAALLMAIVFGCFVTGRIGNVQQIGLGLAVAVVVDATVVRCVLVPATMTLLGRWNWWAPVWLRRVHTRIGLAERRLPPVPVAAPEREPEPEPALS
jgi:putative drug exporter of the RND superfamily